MKSIFSTLVATCVLVGGVAFGAEGGFQGQIIRKAENASVGPTAIAADKAFRAQMAHPHAPGFRVRKANADSK